MKRWHLTAGVLGLAGLGLAAAGAVPLARALSLGAPAPQRAAEPPPAVAAPAAIEPLAVAPVLAPAFEPVAREVAPPAAPPVAEVAPPDRVHPIHTDGALHTDGPVTPAGGLPELSEPAGPARPHRARPPVELPPDPEPIGRWDCPTCGMG